MEEEVRDELLKLKNKRCYSKRRSERCKERRRK
jgi:hypothetical protein